MSTKKKKRSLGTFSILLIVLLFVFAISWIFNGKPYMAEKEGKMIEMTVVGATVGQLVLAPIQGFLDAGEVIGFVFCLGGFLSLVTATGALETGIKGLVRKLHGKENVMIAILMAIFALGGSTYGMCEETVGFYFLLGSTMLAAGMDPMVGVATVLLGAGVGCLGSTVNPFAVTVAVDAAKAAGAEADLSKIITIGLVLVIVTYIIATFSVVKYANKVKADKGKSIFTGEELAEFEEKYGTNAEGSQDSQLTGRQKASLWVFALTFVVMIFGFIPMEKLNEGIYNAMAWSKYLTGNQFGDWYFVDAAMWFTIMGFVIGWIGVEDHSKLSNIFVAGVADMISVNLVIALARASSVIMGSTGVGPYLVQASVQAMQAAHVSGGIFGCLDYLLHLGLSFLVPSSSGLAGISSPIVPPIAKAMGFSVDATIMAEVAANGVVNLITPTNGAIMGGLALASVPYATWVKWSWKTVTIIAVVTGIIITAAMLAL